MSYIMLACTDKNRSNYWIGQVCSKRTILTHYRGIMESITSATTKSNGSGPAMSCNNPDCKKPYGCSGGVPGKGEKGGVGFCDGNGSSKPNPPSTSSGDSA